MQLLSGEESHPICLDEGVAMVAFVCVVWRDDVWCMRVLCAEKKQ